MTGATSISQHAWWLAGRASGVVALALVTLSVGIGLTMSARLMRRPGLARRLTAVHEQAALTGLVAIAVHGLTLLGDPWLHPGLSGITVPFVSAYRPFWTGLGIVGGWLAAVLGLTFYARRWIGPRRWRRAHRPTVAVYALRCPHDRRGNRRRLAMARWAMVISAVPIALPLPRAACCRGAGSSRRRVRYGPARPRRGRPHEAERRRHRGRRARGAALLRNAPHGRHDGRIVMVGAEDRPPYDRPPLSKELLAGTRTPDTLGFRSAEWYDDAGVELRLGVGARRLDPATRALELRGGERLVYDRLLVATGARPRRLTALDGYDNVLALRDADDAHRLRTFLEPGAQLAVVGAGFIGLEVASTARALGAKVTVVEALETPLAGSPRSPAGTAARGPARSPRCGGPRRPPNRGGARWTPRRGARARRRTARGVRRGRHRRGR